MNSYISFGIGVAVGGVISGAIVHILTKKSCDKKFRERVDSISSYYTQKEQEIKKTANLITVDAFNDQPHISEPDTSSAVDFTSYARIEEAEFETERKIILEDDYEYIPGYSQLDYVLYYDGILTDDADQALSGEDVDDIFGANIYDQLFKICKDYELAYVRDPLKRTDYKVMFCSGRFDG